MKTKDVYVKQIQAQLDEWDADIRKLRAKAEKTSANVTLGYKARIETLQREREKAGDKLAELKSASDDAWEDLKTGLDSATHALGSALRSAAARF